MNRLTTLAAAISLAALAGCGGTATNEAGNAAGNEAVDNGAAPTNDSTAANDTAPATAAVAPSGELATFLVGRWTDDGDCTATTEFRADGTFTFPWGDTGQWSLNGDQLTMTGNSSATTIRRVDERTVERANAGGEPHRATRC